MNKILIFFGVLLTICCKQPLSQRRSNMINFSSYSFSLEDNMSVRNSILILHLENYIIYRTTTIDISGDPSSQHIDIADTVGKKSYNYYFINKGATKGFVYTQGKWKEFKYDAFLKSNGLDFSNYNFLKLELGNPDKIEKSSFNQIIIEKYVNKLKGKNEPDSLYRYYDEQLKDIDFSFNETFDLKMKSKLFKIGLIYSFKPKGQSSTIKKEAFWMINKTSDTKEEEKMQQLLKQFLKKKMN